MIQLPTRVDAEHNYAVYRNVRTPMRDGVELSSNIFFPIEDGKVNFDKKYPTILIRTAYAYGNGEYATQPINLAYYAADLGYVVVIQSCRGSYLSEGELHPMTYEENDGRDTAAWIVKQPWSNGKIAVSGHSWLGGTAFKLAMDAEAEGIETGYIRGHACNPIDTAWVCDGDFLDVGSSAPWWVSQILDLCHNKHVSDELIEKLLADNEEFGQPLTNPAKMDNYGWWAAFSPKNYPLVRHIPAYQEWLQNRDNRQYFIDNGLDIRNRKYDVNRPVLFSGSWQDSMLLNTLSSYVKAVEEAPNKEIAEGHRIVIGPWGHMHFPFPGMFNLAGNSDTDDRIIAMEWIDSKLNNRPSEFFDNNRVVMYVQGENRWRSEKAWPIADAATTKMYLHSAGKANSSAGDGVLSCDAPSEEAADIFISDPMNPVYAPGGHSLWFGAMADQSEVEKREDMLVYTSATLDKDIEVTGTPMMKLYASTDADDTDFIVKLIDVATDGTSLNVTSGGRRARYLKAGRENPQPVVPGELLEVDVELRPTSYVFKAGHKLRIDICGSDAFNREVGVNRFIDLNSATRQDGIIATQQIFHDSVRASVIELPVVGEDHERNWIDEWPFDAKLTGMDMNKSMTMMPGWDVIMTPPEIRDISELPIVDGTVCEAADVHNAVDTIRF